MKYLEELSGGDCFEHNGYHYVLSRDFKANGDKMCISMTNGFQKWLSSNSIVSHVELFTTDKDNNIIAFKTREKQNDYSENKNIS
jgi:hypothetical protein